MSQFFDVEAIIFYLIIGTIPIHAFIMMYFLNRRWFRRKKRGMLMWAASKGLVDEPESRAERARRRDRNS